MACAAQQGPQPQHCACWTTDIYQRPDLMIQRLGVLKVARQAVTLGQVVAGGSNMRIPCAEAGPGLLERSGQVLRGLGLLALRARPGLDLREQWQLLGKPGLTCEDSLRAVSV